MDKLFDKIHPMDFAAPVVFLPVRHHSPACAFHVARVIRQLRPRAVLIEGPNNATPLIALLQRPETKPPVAIFTTYVRGEKSAKTERFSAYYPICDYSPELLAIQTALEIDAVCEFIDLNFDEKIDETTTNEVDTTKPDNLLAERYSKQSRFIQSACERTGTRDPDDLWDHLYELDYRDRDSDEFFRNVLAYCTLMREDHTPEMLTADGTLQREASMKQRIDTFAAQFPQGQILVVSGGFHTVAFLHSQATEKEGKQKRKSKSATKTENSFTPYLIRYGFEQLDRLNGYASGMPSPEFYQRDWENLSTADTLVELARLCRKKNMPISTADEIAALGQMERLAQLRKHAKISREDFWDGIRSTFVKGADDSDGLPVLAVARKMLAGKRVGQVPEKAGQPPIIADFKQICAELKVVSEFGDGKEISLDLYRNVRDRKISRFFRQLDFLDVSFATWKRGPNFLSGENLERIQEIWNYRWSPEVESTLIIRSVYGATIRETASALLLERFAEGDRRADNATRLIVSACLMGLHELSGELLEKAKSLIAEDALFESLVATMELLIGLHVSREPLEAGHLHGLEDIAIAAYHRACFLIPELAYTTEAEEDKVVDSLCTLSQAILSLGDLPEHRELRWDRLRILLGVTEGNQMIRGATAGILYGDGQLHADALLQMLQGSLLGPEGTVFLRGLMRTARSVLWQIPECIDTLHERLKNWDEDQFIAQLPFLRLAFSNLTPRECDQFAKRVAERTGMKPFAIHRSNEWTEADLIAAAKINTLTTEVLKRDSLLPEAMSPTTEEVGLKNT